MNIISDYLVKLVIEEKHREAAHRAEVRQAIRMNKARRQAESPKNDIFQLLARLISNMRFGLKPHTKRRQADESLFHTENSSIASKDLSLYEHITQGNALVEAEYRAQKLREGK